MGQDCKPEQHYCRTWMKHMPPPPLLFPPGDCLAGFWCKQGAQTRVPSDGLSGGTCSPGHDCPSGIWFTLFLCPPVYSSVTDKRLFHVLYYFSLSTCSLICCMSGYSLRAVPIVETLLPMKVAFCLVKRNTDIPPHKFLNVLESSSWWQTCSWILACDWMCWWFIYLRRLYA